ncbi:MAG: PEP-utilizing enzyme [Patescibacteria group bacterium]
MMKIWGKKYLQETDCLDFADRPGYFLLLSTADHAVSYSDKYLPKSNYIGVSRKERINFFHPKDNLRRPFRKIFLRYWNHPAWLTRQYVESCRTVKALKSEVDNWHGEVRPSVLGCLFLCYLQARYLPIRGINILRKTDAALQEFMADHCGYLSAEIIQALSFPEKSSVIMQEKEAILHAALHWRHDRKKTKLIASAKKIYRQFGACTMGWHNEAPRPLNYYIQQIKYWGSRQPEKVLAEMHIERKQSLRRRDKARMLVKRRHWPLRKLLAMMPYLKDAVKLQVNLANFYFMPVFAAMSKKYGVRIRDMWRMSVEEVFTMISSGQMPDQDVLIKRKGLYVYYSYKGRFEIFYGKKAKYFLSRFYQTSHSLKSGRVASPGLARGRVRIVRSQKDFPKFKKGNILVVNNTTPDFVPIMKKAAAIVAEEGGITAHVSIVSRELKIPCVIGVYKAMSVLKNGDRVEVDAERGVVRKL